MGNWFTIYTTSAFECPYCIKAKDLLQVYGFDYHEKDINQHEEYKKEFLERGFKQVPQLYFEKTLVGGYNNSKDFLRKKFFENYSPEKKKEILEQLEKLYE